MDVFFPIGYPWPTTFYLTLYVLTLLLHVVPMNYVLAGSTYWAATAFFARPEHAATGRNPLSQLLRDWMPFALGIAITAAIAPLLFLQLLYKQSFYTANLLLFHRWMSILPVLILAFYLLYLRKAKGVDRWPLASRIAIALAAGLCFLFVAWSWTENHLLALAQDQWPVQYASGKLVYWSREQVPRLAVWYLGAFPTLAILLGWQVQFHLRRSTPWPESPVPRLLRIALGALLASALAGLVYFFSLDAETRGTLSRHGGSFYMGLALVGWASQMAAWFVMWRKRSLSPVALSVATVALVVTLLSATVLRELRRLAAIDIQALFEEHAAAASVEGLPVFLVFLALNAALIFTAILVVKRNLLPTPSSA